MPLELKDKLYTSTQVADILGVSLRTLYRYMEDGKIKSMRTASGRHRFTKEQILEFLNAGQSFQQAPDVRPSYSDDSIKPQNVNQTSSMTSIYSQSVTPLQQTSTSEVSDRSSVTDSSSDASVSNQYQKRESLEYSREFSDQVSHTPQQADNTQTPVDTSLNDSDWDFDEPASTQIQEKQTFSGEINDPVKEPSSQFQTPQYSGSQSEVSNRYTSTESFSPASSQVETESFSAPQSVSTNESVDLGVGISIRYYKSEYSDLIELARKIKEVASSKDLEYAFTLFAGLSLHILLKPFTLLHVYANPEDMQIWKDGLRLTPVQKRDDANVGIIINTDIVFVPTREIGGFKVVDDKVLLKDLSTNGEEELVKQFREHLTKA